MSLHQLLNKYFPFSYKNTINKKKRTKRAQNSSTQQINPDEKIKLYTFLTTTTRKIVLSCLHLDARRKCVDQELKKHFFPTLRERKKKNSGILRRKKKTAKVFFSHSTHHILFFSKFFIKLGFFPSRHIPRNILIYTQKKLTTFFPRSND